MATDKSSIKILIVEDEINNLNLLEMRLLSLGYSVETAANGLVALEKLKAAPASFQFVVTDLKMPVMDGLSLIREIKTEKNLDHVLAIVMTGFADRKLIQQSKDSGIRDVLLKPFPFDELLRRIEGQAT